MLTLSELRELRSKDPSELYEYLELDVRSFLFGVVDQSASFGETWGGEHKAIINQNVVLEFVPFLTEEMASPERCPQFSVMPHPKRAGQEQIVRFPGDEKAGLDPYEGVIFFVSPKDYQALRDELTDVAVRYEEFMGVPDTWFLNTKLVHLITKRVLEHSLVKAERRYDFSKPGYTIFQPRRPDSLPEADAETVIREYREEGRGPDLPQ